MIQKDNHNEVYGHFQTFHDLLSCYHVIYVAKYFKNNKKKSLDTKHAKTKISMFEVLHKKHSWNDMLKMKKIQVLDTFKTPLLPNHSYIKKTKREGFVPVILVNPQSGGGDPTAINSSNFGNVFTPANVNVSQAKPVEQSTNVNVLPAQPVEQSTNENVSPNSNSAIDHIKEYIKIFEKRYNLKKLYEKLVKHNKINEDFFKFTEELTKSEQLAFDYLPCEELLHTLSKLRYIKKIKLSSAQGGNEGNPGSEDIDYLTYLNDSYASESESESEWTPDIEDLNQYVKDEQLNYEFIQQNQEEKKKWKILCLKSAIIICFFSIMMSMFAKYNVGYNFYTTTNNTTYTGNNQLSDYFENSIKPLTSETDIFLYTKKSDNSWLFTRPDTDYEEIKVSVSKPNSTMSNIQFLENLYTTEPPSCSISKVIMMNPAQQLLIHKHNVFESFLHLFNYLSKNEDIETYMDTNRDETNDVIIKSIRETIEINNSNRDRDNYVDVINKNLLPNLIKLFNKFLNKTSNEPNNAISLLENILQDSNISKQLRYSINRLKNVIVQHVYTQKKGIPFT